jgi:hypothetical protein
MRLQHLVMKYQDMAALAQDRERVVTFTRCEIHEGVTGDDMRAVHQRALDQRDELATNLYWGVKWLHFAGHTNSSNLIESIRGVSSHEVKKCNQNLFARVP